MKIIYLLTVAVIACVFVLTTQSVNADHPAAPFNVRDFVLLRCDTLTLQGGSVEFVVVTDTRSALAPTEPTLVRRNCAEAVALLNHGSPGQSPFDILEVLGTSSGGGFTIIFRRAP